MWWITVVNPHTCAQVTLVDPLSLYVGVSMLSTIFRIRWKKFLLVFFHEKLDDHFVSYVINCVIVKLWLLQSIHWKLHLSAERLQALKLANYGAMAWLQTMEPWLDLLHSILQQDFASYFQVTGFHLKRCEASSFYLLPMVEATQSTYENP